MTFGEAATFIIAAWLAVAVISALWLRAASLPPARSVVVLRRSYNRVTRQG